ncbi:hypothetical protein CS390_09260 [Pseudomonas sp. HLS-6]|uniref:hypothetical protein n=1 Tax=Pseudomonas sp. HLS-6 TaxID=2049589 RepID=UPI000C18F87D|nr:hypothetical protein [Pseudomonas sp. HLS-6]ATR82735.1 hypothetical protein CS390_09260 [Pseudomonas sp. HLS-6]
MSFRTALALIFTVLYVCGFGFIAICRQDELVGLSLNELGDFLAGAFGPLALSWLVFGYFQQGDELKQGTEALLLQAQELKESVQQQSEMAAATRLSLRNNEKALEPILHLNFMSSAPAFTSEGHVYKDQFSLSNSGAYCEDLVVRASLNSVEVAVKSSQGLAVGRTFSFDFIDILDDDVYYDFDVSYRKSNGTTGRQSFEVSKRYSNGELQLVVEKQYLEV